jgi:hypothetical protein
MRDSWHALLKWADYHRGVLAAGVIVTALAGYLVGCEPRTHSLISPGDSITASQLVAETQIVESNLDRQRNELVREVSDFNEEVARFNEATEAAVVELQRQHELRQQITETIGGFASDAVEGRFNPISAISALVTLITVGTASGLMVDNVRKNRVIKLLKDDGQTSNTKPDATS